MPSTRHQPIASAPPAVTLAMLGLCLSAPATARASTVAEATTSIFGPQVQVFDPGMPMADIQATATRIFTTMESNQFGAERHALLFKPGDYAVTFNVGFYTQVAGLGRNPDDVRVQGGVNITAKWMPDANATCNFWRALENFSVTPSATKGATTLAVSQAAPMRRLHIKGALHLFDFDDKWRAGWASGGFLADSVVDGEVVSASQQQWLSRNCSWTKWSNGVWNMVFVGDVNAPQGEFPAQPYTVVARTPIIREKPYLTISATGQYEVFVPDLQKDTTGVSWASGPTPGTAVPIDRFFIAQPATANAAAINAALAAGKHLLFTPGIYRLDDSVKITKPGTIVLGLGVPSLLETTGRPVISVADVDGVEIAGLILEAGAAESASILEVGPAGSAADHAANPTFLYDLTVRTGGTTPGRNRAGITINSRHVVADQIWLWRADHGAGAAWATNPTRNGLVVNGDGVTIYGLFNEHHEEYQTLWNGNGGRVYFYQSEIPYDVPDQAAWRSATGDGYASYKVADTVTTHEAWGLGVYCFFRDAPVKLRCAIEAPVAPGVRFHDLTTIWLNGQPGSGITYIINDLGGKVSGNKPAAAMRQTWRSFGGPEVGSRQ